MPVSAASREHETSLFSSSPAHPSHTRQPSNRHHQSNNQPQGPNPSTARKNPLKRSASTLLTPPSSAVKKKPTNANPGRPAAVVSRKSTSTLSTGELRLDSPDPDDEEVDAALRTSSSRSSRAGLSRQSTTVSVTGGKTRPQRRRTSTHTDGNISSSPIERSSTSFVSIKSGKPSPTTGALQGVDSMNLDDDEDEKAKDNSPGLPTTPRLLRPRRGVDSPGSPTSEVVRRRGIATPKTPAKTGLNRKAVSKAPIRDSPHNPFLSTGTSSAGPSKSREPFEEKPMMTYVFRGKKAYYRNPAYGVPAPKEGDPSTLPPEDPNFSPDLLTRPKLLWPGVDGGAEESSEEGTGPVKPLRLLDERGQSDRALKRRRME